MLLLAAAFPARLAYGMISLAIYFKIFQNSDSVALAALGIGLNGLAGALTAGIRASFIDRYGLLLPLRVFAPAYSVMIILFNSIDSNQALLIVAFILGLTAPPINLSVRPIWKITVPTELHRTAYALDTAAMSISGIIGPPIATVLALSKMPSLSLYVTAGLMTFGGLALSALPTTRKWEPEKIEGKRKSVLRSKAIQVLLIEGIIIGLGSGAFIIAIPAIATLEKVQSKTGLFLSVEAIFMIVGSFIAGLVSKKYSSLKTFRVNYIFWIIATAPLIYVHANWSLFLACAIIGIVGGAQFCFLLGIIRSS